ncbi:MAG: chemotaxis protein CheY [Paenibacillaceae bacterium]|jgi:DNA-binding response OmpR family regulator|nr:chemotaxis protein CheY [Paenibacillaceae bacterium]
MINHVLIIEDNKEMNDSLCSFLQSHGYRTTAAYSGLVGLEKARGRSIDLIVLDLMLPYRSGSEMLREVRNRSEAPVIAVVSEEMQHASIAEFLQLGADDCIVAPFDPGELLTRVENVLLTAAKPVAPSGLLTWKDLVLHRESKTVTAASRPVVLTAKEFEILERLMQTPDRVLSKESLFESIWNDKYTYEDKTINTHISNLRTKLKKANPAGDYIETVWGAGYKCAD